MFDKEGLYFLPLGGADEVGLNLYVYAVDGKFIIVDCGYGFLNDDYPGMELAFPDAGFLEQYKDKIEGLFITHAHEDHFGAIGYIWPKLECPVYATDFACGLMRERLKDFHMEDIVPLNSVSNNKIIKTDTFEVEFVSMVHSVPETSALVIRTKYGNIVHATDWRFDDEMIKLLPTDFKALEKVAEEGVLLFVGDSTNLSVEEQAPTEHEIRNILFKLIPTFKEGLLVTCFASNLVRLETLILAAYKANRTPVIVGRSLLKNLQVAKEVGYFKDLPRYYDIREEGKDVPHDKAMYITTGSQATYRSALPIIANGDNKYVKLSEGDAVIFSSKIIPGNEDKIEALQDKIAAQGVEVLTEQFDQVHTSGHPSKAELKRMYEILKPKIAIPVHGEKRYVRAHKEFALECGVKEVEVLKDGDLAFIKNNKVSIIDNVPTNVIGVDRKQTTPLDSQLIRNRKRIAFNCSVFITVVYKGKWDVKDLQISSIDILEENAWNQLAEEIKAQMLELIPTKVEEFNGKDDRMLDFIRSSIRKRIENATGIKAITFMHDYRI